MSDRRLLKFKHKGKVTVVYESGKNWVDKTTMETGDTPTQGLADALQAMARHLCTMCELPAEYADQITVQGVSLDYTEYTTFEVRGLVISGLRTLKGSWQPMVVNSPRFTDDENQDRGKIDSDCYDDLEELVSQVWRFIDGERIRYQQELFPGESGDEVPKMSVFAGGAT